MINKNVISSVVGVVLLSASTLFAFAQNIAFASSYDSNIPEGALIRAIGDVDIYIVKYVGAKRFKRLILSPSVFNNYGHLRWEDVREVAPEVRDGFTTSYLVRAVDDARVFMLYPKGDIGERRWIATADIFTAYGFDWDSIYEINSFDRDSYVMGADCTSGAGPGFCWDPKNCETPDCVM
ncbi:MAG: hypothetical protein Q8Q39_04765 [bacterium]|nr:hypothetical protein [bacterium]MDP3963780.1 hypothetical protein [bacterium]